MAEKIALTGTSVTTLDRINVSEGLALLGKADQFGAVPLIITAPRASMTARLAPVRRNLLSHAGATFVMMTPTGLRVVAKGESPAIDNMMPFVVHTNAFSFQLIYHSIPTKAGAGEAVPLEVMVRGTAQVASMDALLARTHQGLPYVLSVDWQAAREMYVGSFIEILAGRTYTEHKVLGLPGQAGVTKASVLSKEMQDAVQGALAGLSNTNNVFVFKDVTVEVRPPEYIRKREEAQEALVAEFSQGIQRAVNEPFWSIRRNISASLEKGSLDAENATRLLITWEARAVEHLSDAIQGTNDPKATGDIIDAAEVSKDSKGILHTLLDARAAALKEEQRANARADLVRAITGADLKSVPDIGQRVRNDARITPEDRKEFLAKLEEKRVSLSVGYIQGLIGVGELNKAEEFASGSRLPEGVTAELRASIQEKRERIKAEEARLRKLEEEQQPKAQEFLGRIPGADREALTLVSLQVAREAFVQPLLANLQSMIAKRDQELGDQVEACAQAEVARRVSEVDVQARVVIAANMDPSVRARLNEAAELLNNEGTRVQAAIALRAASASDRGVRDGFLGDAAELLGAKSRPALGAGTESSGARPQDASTNTNDGREQRHGRDRPRGDGKRAAPTR